jgi:hypothetical protein
MTTSVGTLEVLENCTHTHTHTHTHTRLHTVVAGIEPRTFLGKCSITEATPSALIFILFLRYGITTIFVQVVLKVMILLSPVSRMVGA